MQRGGLIRTFFHTGAKKAVKILADSDLKNKQLYITKWLSSKL